MSVKSAWFWLFTFIGLGDALLKHTPSYVENVVEAPKRFNVGSQDAEGALTVLDQAKTGSLIRRLREELREREARAEQLIGYKPIGKKRGEPLNWAQLYESLGELEDALNIVEKADADAVAKQLRNGSGSVGVKVAGPRLLSFLQVVDGIEESVKELIGEKAGSPVDVVVADELAKVLEVANNAVVFEGLPGYFAENVRSLTDQMDEIAVEAASVFGGL